MSLMSTNGSRRTSGINCGFTLIEVLISLTLLAVGMLGMTALQTESLKFNNAALTDSQAQFLLQDMSERIRANKGNNTYVMSYTDELEPVTVDCAVTDCTENFMALWDMTQWRDSVAETLPQGESQILFNTLNRTYVISVRYDWSQLGGEDITNGKRTVSITTRI
jgi:type IV pilus assembly protein PilV